MTYTDPSRSSFPFWHAQYPQAVTRPLTWKDLQEAFQRINEETGVYTMRPTFLLASMQAFNGYCDLLREGHAAWMAKLAKGAMRILGDTSPHMTNEQIQQWPGPAWSDPLDNDEESW